MSDALTTTRQHLPALQMNEAELMRVLGNSLYPGAEPESIKMVVSYCKAAGLDPMQKPVHIVPMWDGNTRATRDVIMPGIGLYRVQAARNGCAGVSEPEFGPDVTENIGGVSITYPQWCRITAKRRLQSGETAEFTAKEFWRENYAVKGGRERSIAPNAMWQKRPYGQLAKCAEAQALRKAFPEIGSSPTADEMEGRALNEYAAPVHHMGDVVPEPPRNYPPADFEKNVGTWAEKIASGAITEARLLSMVQTKGALLDEQITALRERVMELMSASAPTTVDAETGEVIEQGA